MGGTTKAFPLSSRDRDARPVFLHLEGPCEYPTEQDGMVFVGTAVLGGPAAQPASVRPLRLAIHDHRFSRPHAPQLQLPLS